MHLTLTVGEQTHPLDVPTHLLTEAQDFFSVLDKDMDCGWQMSREWVDYPNTLQRCQIVADRILSAIHQENQAMVGLACAYILQAMPETTHIEIDTSGDITQTLFEK